MFAAVAAEPSGACSPVTERRKDISWGWVCRAAAAELGRSYPLDGSLQFVRVCG